MQKIQQDFVIRGDGEKHLSVALDVGNSQHMSNLVLLYEGKNVGYFADATGAKDGLSLDVPDLGKVNIRINSGMFSKPKIFATLNGHILQAAKKAPAPGDLNNYQKWDKAVKTGSGVLFFISGISILGSIAAILFEVQFLLEMGMGGITMCAGLIFLGLGFAGREISWGGFAALVFALLLYVADTLLIVAMQMGGGNMFIRVVFTFLLVQAIYASFRLLTTPPEIMGNRYGIVVEAK